MRNNIDFQTPPELCDHMAHMISLHGGIYWPIASASILEPTPGAGNLIRALKSKYPNATITAPDDFFYLVPGIFNRQLQYPRFDYIVMNPPFSPMIQGWKFLQHCMQMSDIIVCLLPWFVPLNSKKRLKIIQDFGLVSITHLPREAFPDSRIQCCLLHLYKNYRRETTFKTFEFKK